MDFDMKDSKKDATTVVGADATSQADSGEPCSNNVLDISIDPKQERAALRKFDQWLVPVAFIFMVLSSLDRNNVSEESHLPDPLSVKNSLTHRSAMRERLDSKTT